MKDKVLIVTPFYPPQPAGAAVYFHKLSEYLKEEMEVLILTTRDSSHLEPESGIRVFRTIPNLLASYVPDSSIYRLLRYLILPAATFLSIFFIFLKYRPGIMHVHSSTAITFGASIFSFLFRVPVVIDVRDMFPEKLPLRWVIKIGRSPRYIALGKRVNEMLLSIGISQGRILTQPLARDYSTKKITDMPRHGGSGGEVKILFVGELSKIKGIDILLESFRLASGKSPDLSLKIIGDGPMRGFCEKFIAQNNLNVELLGKLNHESTLKEISASDIFTLASKTEGYPRVILEAFEFERPVIAARVGGIPEMLKDGENGILVNSGDVKGFAEAMTTLGEDASLRKKLGKRGNQSLKDLPDWKEISKEIIEFYRL